MSSLDSFFGSIQLPPISEVAHELIRSLNNESVSVREVRDIIAKDPALTAQLLRIANSAQFGMPRGVSSLDDSISMVGMARVRALSLTACMAGAFPSLPGLDKRSFWQYSMACAGYAQWMAVRLDIDGQIAWLTGMMLRLGELLIAQAEPKALAEIEARPCPPGERWKREKQTVGFSECQVTAEMARRWNFPMLIVQALQRASDPVLEQAYSRLGAIVHLAGLLADTPNAGPKALADLPLEVIDSLKLDLDWMDATFPGKEILLDVAVV
jgi:HD-like signal output (HDOD) protein